MGNNNLHNEKDLFVLIAQGDEVAFEQLFNAYVLKVSRMVFRIVKSEAVTKDIVQDVFLKLWLVRYKLPEIEDPRLYINRIAYNSSYDYIRQQLLHERIMSDMGIELQLLEHVNDVEALLDLRETSRLIVKAVDSLHPRSREIYQMNRSKGMKPQVIADELGISVQSVRNSLTRSAKLIRDYLSQRGIVIPMMLLLLPIPELFM